MNNEISFEYQIVRYAHDPSSGEMLNIGIIVYAHELPRVSCMVNQHFGRLSKAFADFDGNGYRRVVRGLESEIKSFNAERFENVLELYDIPPNIESITGKIWPDGGLSYRFSRTLGGVTSDLAASLARLYDRFVVGQYERDDVDRRTDDDVWTLYQSYLNAADVGSRLVPETIKTSEVEVKFDHTYRNGRLYAFQPLSMDLAKRESIQTKATNLLGKTVAIRDGGLGKLYVLLGRPSNESFLPDYYRAKSLLSKSIAIEHEMIEEDQALDLSNRIREEMTKHGLIPVAKSLE